VRRRGALVVTLALTALALTACGGPDNSSEEDLRAAISRTERLARTFVYTEKSGGDTNQVVGLIEDDFRSKARLTVDDEPVFDQVQSDDVLAVRFLDVQRVSSMLDERAPGAPTAKTTPADAIDPVEALQTHRWVLDPAGAPPLVQTEKIDRQLGEDPVLDALDAFRYLRAAIGGASRVIKFNPDSLDYKPKEDPFPHPKGDVIRYDLERPRLPRASIEAGGAPPLPGDIHIRKMSIYVDHGLVIRVLEQVDPAERLDDIIDNAANYLRDVNASDAAVQRVLALKDEPPAQAAQAVIAGVNLFRDQSGDDPIRLRTMTLEFDQLGGKVHVDVPTDYVAADLEILKFRGRDQVEVDKTSGRSTTTTTRPGASSPSSTTSTTAAGG
jgi:hypothetical protein